MLSGSFYRFFLLGLCVSLLRQWCRCEWKGEGLVQDNNLAVKHLLHGHLRKTRLWRRVVGETRHSRGKGRPAWFLLGILFLSGDVELNPGPKTRAADKEEGHVVKVTLQKTAQEFGFTMIGGDHLGEYLRIKNIIPGSIADRDGMLMDGDILVRINGIFVMTYSHQEVMDLLQDFHIGSHVTIEVCRGEISSEYGLLEKSVDIIKGPQGFGFSLGESALGPVVKLITNFRSCAELQEGDLILKVNDESVRYYTHEHLTAVLESCPKGNQATFLVHRRHSQDEPILRDDELRIPSGYTILKIHLTRQVQGFGFKISGGRRKGSQANVGGILSGGAAAVDGRLQIGDELLMINGNSVLGMLHSDVANLIRLGGDTVELIIRRQIKESLNFDGEIQRHKEAYIKIIEEKLSVDIDIIRLVYFGLPRSGKTSTMRRLMGDMLNILIGMRGKEEPSTGVADVKQIFVRNIYSEVGTIISSKWSRTDLQEEAAMLTQFFYQVAKHSAVKDPSSPQRKPPPTGKEESSPSTVRPSTDLTVNEATAQISPTTEFRTSNPSLSSASSSLSPNREASRDKGADIDDMFSAFEEAIKTDSLDKVKYLLEDTTLLINTDTGGHAEFLEMHAALVMGPSLYLLFSRLTDKLESLFKVYYTNEEGKSSEKEDSTLTMEEVFFQALSSIACFSGSSPDVSDTVSGVSAENCKQTKYCTSHSESKALFVGTHLDKINQRKLKKKDELLQKKVTCTSFYTKGIIERASEDQLMLAVNNYSGGQEEIEEVRNILERIIKNRFKKIRIPAAWLMLSLYIRRKDLRVMTLDECARLAAKLGIDPQEELQEALWFLHHCVGLILYYPKLDVLKDTVICDVQVVFDSVTKLVKNTFTLDKVTPTRVDEFREKAQFTMEDIENSASSGTDATIPLDKLVKLLEYLNILTRFTPTKARSGEVTYFMPSILRSARADDLKVRTSRKDPAPLMLRYNCGYVPFGVFSYMITNIVSKQPKWRLIEDKIWKNKVQFHVGSDYDNVTLISRPLYIEVVVSRSSNPQTPTKVLCAHIRQVVLSTLKIERNFTRDFKFAFECPAHSGRDHLCVLASETARQMECLKNPKKILPIPLKDSRCMVWFEESSTDDERHASEATPQSLRDSLPTNMDEKELTSDDHGEVLDSVESLSAQWRRLSSKLRLKGSSLNRIEENNRDCMMCLDKALVEWLNLNYNHSKYGRPSWKRLATAVKELDYALFEKIVWEHQAETTAC